MPHECSLPDGLLLFPPEDGSTKKQSGSVEKPTYMQVVVYMGAYHSNVCKEHLFETCTGKVNGLIRYDPATYNRGQAVPLGPATSQT